MAKTKKLGKTFPQLKSLNELLSYIDATYKDKVAFRYKTGNEVTEVTYSQFKADVEAFGTYLYSVGLKDKHVSLVGENSYEWIVSYFAVVCGGGVIVPVDKELKPADICEIIDRSDSVAFIHSDKYSEAAAMAEGKLCINLKDYPECHAKGKELIRAGEKSFTECEIDIEKLCTIIYTSGTTGKPKGVMLCQKGITVDAVDACEFADLLGSNLTALPLHHSFAFTACVVAALVQGVTVFINNSLKDLFKDFGIARPFHFLAVPMMLEAIYKKINKGIDKSGKRKLINMVIALNKALLKVGIDIRHILFKQIREPFGGNLQLLVTGGAVANPAVIQGLIDLGFIVLNGYGISECSPIVSVNATYDWKVGTIGKVLKGCEVKIIDGEICVRGDIVMLGYYKDPEASAATFDGEWFRTGDLGYFDDDGFLYINGRKKNLIILNNGKNVSPEELEVLISNIENVVEVVVYGEDDLIAAEIFAEDKTGIEEGIALINETLPKYKKINRIKFRDTEFDKTTTKKIKR